jgi:hypothetical protein
MNNNNEYYESNDLIPIDPMTKMKILIIFFFYEKNKPENNMYHQYELLNWIHVDDEDVQVMGNKDFQQCLKE